MLRACAYLCAEQVWDDHMQVPHVVGAPEIHTIPGLSVRAAVSLDGWRVMLSVVYSCGGAVSCAMQPVAPVDAAARRMLAGP